MKKNKFYFILLIALALIALTLYLTRRSGTIPQELKDFAIEDTASVSQIFLAGKSGQSIHLIRKESHWEVNGKYHARKDAVDVLLKTLLRMDVKSPVPQASFETVVTNLAAEHTKVEIYTAGNEPEKVFYVGGSTADNYGTYMMLEKSSTPFIMHIPGFAGYLSTRFFLDENAWRDVGLFRYRFDEIKSVTLENIRQPEQSFTAINHGNNQFDLLYASSNQPYRGFDTLKVKEYLSAFKKLNFERFVDELTETQIDSVFQLSPEYIIRLEDTYGKTTQLKATLRKAELDDEYYQYDVDRMYGRIDENDELVIIQYFNFDPLFRDIDDFRLTPAS